MQSEKAEKTNIVSARAITLETTLRTFNNLGLDHDFGLSVGELSHVIITRQLPPNMPKRRKRFPISDIVASVVADYEEETKQDIDITILRRYGWTREEIADKVEMFHEKPKLRIVPEKKTKGDSIEPDKQYMNDIGRYRLIPSHEVSDIVLRIRQGDIPSRKEMITRNLRLVISIAKNYKGRGIDYEDLIGFGNLGLMKAVERYDLTEGAKFSTYASWWIKQTMRRAIVNHSNTVRVPAHMVETKGKIRRLNEEHYSKFGRYLDEDELIVLTGKRENEIRTALTSVKKREPFFEDSDYVDDDGLPKGIHSSEKSTAISRMYEGFSKLTEREQLIIRLRYGIGGEVQTLDVVGKRIGLTRERTRQIETKALRKLQLFCGAITPKEYAELTTGKNQYKK